MNHLAIDDAISKFMKSPFPDYMIQIDDRRFVPVLQSWVTNLINVIRNDEFQNHTMQYHEHTEFWVGNHADITLEESIRRDLRKFTGLYTGSPIHQILIGYDASRGNTDEIRSILSRIGTKRVRNRVRLDVISSVILSAYVDTDLLEYPIPDINLVLLELLPTSKSKIFWLPHG